MLVYQRVTVQPEATIAWALNTGQMWTSHDKDDKYTVRYPLVNQHNYGKSQFFMGISTINGDVQ
jgi:hypothetical protein